MNPNDDTTTTAAATPEQAATPSKQRTRAHAADARDGGTVTLRHRAASTSDIVEIDDIRVPRGETAQFTTAQAERALKLVDESDRRYFEPVAE